MLASLVRVLSPFFNHAERILFGEAQRLSGLLISGSVALSFFNEETYPDSDLDLFVDFERRLPVFEFLEEAGYQYTKRIGQPPTLEAVIDGRAHSRPESFGITFSTPGDYPGHHVVTVINFRRVDSERIVQVVLTRGLPLYSILQFHSSE